MTRQALVDTAGVSVLVAETVGLLLEPLALDETLGGSQALELALKLSDLLPPGGGGESLASDIRALVQAAMAEAVGREAILRVAAMQRLPADVVDADAALRILGAGVQPEILRGLSGVPEAAQRSRLHQLDTVLARLRPAASAVEAAVNSMRGEVLESITTLPLDDEISALLDGGWLWGAIRTRSDGARDRVARHLHPQARRKTASELADLLRRVKILVQARADLDHVLAGLPDWAVWFVASRPEGRLNERRISALRWVVESFEADRLGTAEIGLLWRKKWRQLLGSRELMDLRGAGSSAPQMLHEPFAAFALHRLRTWLTPPPDSPTQATLGWAAAINAEAISLARAVLAAQVAGGDAQCRAAIDSIVTSYQSPFGPADPSRPLYRAVHERLRAVLEASRAELTGTSPRHPDVAALVSNLREADGDMARALKVASPPRGPLRVAIAGRTKAGKTTLRKALTRDASTVGIGTGAHRTTRTADDFLWDRLLFVDTPGVSAYDDDFDAEIAIAACRDADAVVWVFAEALRLEEAQLLQALLQFGKPVVAVYNAKWRVDRPIACACFAGIQPSPFATQKVTPSE